MIISFNVSVWFFKLHGTTHVGSYPLQNIILHIVFFFKLLIKPKLDIAPKANWKKVGDEQPKDTDIKQRTKLIQFGVNSKDSLFLKIESFFG